MAPPGAPGQYAGAGDIQHGGSTSGVPKQDKPLHLVYERMGLCDEWMTEWVKLACGRTKA